MSPLRRTCAPLFVAAGIAVGAAGAPLAFAQPAPPPVPQCGTTPGDATRNDQMSECALPDDFQLDTGPAPVDQPGVQQSMG